MKFAMNGCLIVGTMDGANVEITQEIGEDNIFIFGARVEEVEKLKEKMRNSPPDNYIPTELKRVFAAITEGRFGSKDVLSELVSSVTYNNDQYLLCHDFTSYIQTQDEVLMF
jgi:starch phosphorylase